MAKNYQGYQIKEKTSVANFKGPGDAYMVVDPSGRQLGGVFFTLQEAVSAIDTHMASENTERR